MSLYSFVKPCHNFNPSNFQIAWIIVLLTLTPESAKFSTLYALLLISLPFLRIKYLPFFKKIRSGLTSLPLQASQ